MFNDGIWVCIKNIGDFKAGTICFVYENEKGDRVVSNEKNTIKKCFPWKNTEKNFTWTWGNKIEIPYVETTKHLSDYIRKIFKKSPKLFYNVEFIKFEVDSNIRRKIQEEIIVYIACIDRDILIEFSEMLINHLSNLSELCKHSMETSIDQEINQLHKIIFELFKYDQNITNCVTQSRKVELNTKLKIFREEYRKSLSSSLDLVKKLN